MSLFPVIAPVASTPPSVDFQDMTVIGPAQTIYTFSGHAIGDAAAGRKIVVGATASGVGNSDISSITVGGESATKRVDWRYYSTTHSIFDLELATGTTADIVVTFGGGKDYCTIYVYALYGFATGTPSATVSEPLAHQLVIDLTMTIPAGGVGIGMVSAALAGMNFTWVNLTEDDDEELDTDWTHSCAHQIYPTLQTNLAVTATAPTAGTPNTYGNGIVYAAA